LSLISPFPFVHGKQRLLSYKYEILYELNKTNLNMPKLPACFKDYNHFGHSLKARSVLSGLIDSLQKPDNNQIIAT